MQLLNDWRELLWLFIGGAVLSYAFPKKQERLLGKTVKRWDYLPAILLMIPFALWSGFRGDVADTYLYRKMFFEASDDLADIPGYFSGGKDPGFTALTTLLKFFIGNNDTLYFMIFAILQTACLCFVFRKYSSDFWISIFLFIASTDYVSWMFNGMRQFIAVCIIFACFGLIIRKKYVPLMIIILLTSLIHGSALLMIPIVFVIQGKPWNFRTILMLLGTMVVIVFIDQFTPILSDLLLDTQYEGLTSNEIWSEDDGTNIIRVLVYSVPMLMSLVGLKYVRHANDPVINVCVNCSIVTMAIYAVSAVTSGIYVGRLPIYTTLMGYISLPWLIDHMFTRDSARFVKGVMVVLYFVFYYYQMSETWGLI